MDPIAEYEARLKAQGVKLHSSMFAVFAVVALLWFLADSTVQYATRNNGRVGYSEPIGPTP